MEKEALYSQRRHWEDTFSDKPEMFGTEPSYPRRGQHKSSRKKA